jgi:hypothetical protein
MMTPTRQSLDTVTEMPDDPAKPLWWWCDALFMAPPVLAELSKATGDRRYLTFLDREWSITSGKLYDPVQHLFYRDSSFLNKHEQNGKGIFWSRGNGWVMAGLVRVLEYMPKDDPLRPKYVEQLQQWQQQLHRCRGATACGALGFSMPRLTGYRRPPAPLSSATHSLTESETVSSIVSSTFQLSKRRGRAFFPMYMRTDVSAAFSPSALLPATSRLPQATSTE